MKKLFTIVWNQPPICQFQITGSPVSVLQQTGRSGEGHFQKNCWFVIPKSRNVLLCMFVAWVWHCLCWSNAVSWGKQSLKQSFSRKMFARIISPERGMVSFWNWLMGLGDFNPQLNSKDVLYALLNLDLLTIDPLKNIPNPRGHFCPVQWSHHKWICVGGLFLQLSGGSFCAMGVVESRHAGGLTSVRSSLRSLWKCHPEGMNIKEKSNYQLNRQTSNKATHQTINHLFNELLN